jgi:hypothetical protein
MSNKFCTNCGNERINDNKFCHNCGHAFQAITKKIENEQAQIKNDYVATFNHPKKDSKLKTLPNIITNLIVSILIIIANSVLDRQVSWGGGESYLTGVLLLLIIIQIIALLFQSKQKSYSILIPTLISFISIFPTYSLYKDFQSWLEYQGYQTQDLAGGDLTLIIFCLVIFISISVLNILFLFRKKGTAS